MGASPAWGLGAPRAPLGAAGKPLTLTSTGWVIADEILVRFADDATAADIALAVARVNGLVTYHGPRTGYRVVRLASARAAAQARAAFAADPLVIDTAWNHVAFGTGISTSPARELTDLQWNLHAMSLDPFAARPDPTGVLVAVLDSGVAYEDYSDALGTYVQAPDLAGVDFAPGYDFINDDEHPNDDQRHGTHVTGVIAASAGIASVAPGVTIMPVKVLDGVNSGTELALAEGIRFAADSGARIANMSLSFPPTYFPSRYLQAAVDYAAQRGVVMVAAAGNHGEALVSYPAAFRDVIAVGASDLADDYASACAGDPWQDTLGSLVPAPYSDHSFALDVLAPAGTIDGDVNGDGKPEAVLAQTFVSGDPTTFDYFFYAGTSQAAAEVTGLAALMLAENPDLDPFEARALLVENTRAMESRTLTSTSGWGAVHEHKAIAAAGNPHAEDPRPRYFADVTVTLHDLTSAVIARAHVEVIDQAGKPVPGAQVFGMYSGAAFASVVGVTGPDGIVVFDSDPLQGALLVAFQVDAIIVGGKMAKLSRAFDRPRGFVRIDSLSLELLSAFGQGISTSPAGISTSPADEPEDPDGSDGSGGPATGSGISTSPAIPLSDDPAFTPISIALDPALFAGTNYRPTLMLPSFSWGLSTAPMAVAVDEAWFLSTFEHAASRRVVSRGLGYGGSPLLFDEASFPTPVVIEDPNPIRIPLIVITFSSGISTSPAGISTSPSGVSTSPSVWVETFYSGIGAALAREYETVLEGWYAYAAGVSTSPAYSGAYTFPVAVFDHLSAVANAYLLFGALDLAAPASYYGDALTAAGMPVAPVAPEADGEGLGVSALP